MTATECTTRCPSHVLRIEHGLDILYQKFVFKYINYLQIIITTNHEYFIKVGSKNFFLNLSTYLVYTHFATVFSNMLYDCLMGKMINIKKH